jgi:hypothetical protein
MLSKPKKCAEQLDHLAMIRSYLVEKRREAALGWAESSDPEVRQQRLAEVIDCQRQIDAVDHAMDDES